MISREASSASINWKHIDGPKLTCSDGTVHWLTVHERIMLRFNFITVEYLDNLYRTDLPQKGDG